MSGPFKCARKAVHRGCEWHNCDKNATTNNDRHTHSVRYPGTKNLSLRRLNVFTDGSKMLMEVRATAERRQSMRFSLECKSTAMYTHTHTHTHTHNMTHACKYTHTYARTHIDTHTIDSAQRQSHREVALGITHRQRVVCKGRQNSRASSKFYVRVCHRPHGIRLTDNETSDYLTFNTNTLTIVAGTAIQLQACW